MRILSEMQSKLASDLMVSDNSTLYTATRLLELLKSGHLSATSYREWPELSRTKFTSTTTDEYYDYPDDFRTDSISSIAINNIPYDKKNYEDFVRYCRDNSARLNTRVAGLTLDVSGAIQPEQFSETVTTTIFSDSDETGNEAIVKFALADALKKTNPNLSAQLEAEARLILDNIWRRTAQRNQRSQRLEHPFFNVPDYFGRNKATYDFSEPEYYFADYQRKIFVASFR